jgi:hypothetical protein
LTLSSIDHRQSYALAQRIKQEAQEDESITSSRR